MSEPTYSSLAESYEHVVRQTVDECSLCGECVSDCLMFPMTPLKDKPPSEIMEAMVALLRDGAFSEEAYLKAFTCAGCGYCTASCPQELDPLLLHEAAKIELVKLGKQPPEPMNFVRPGQRMNLYEILTALQIKPSEARWLKSIPPNPQKVDSLVFLGCSPPALPDRTFAFLDILEKMGVDFVALAGGELCCGTSYTPAAGLAQESEDKARELVAGIRAFSPERVVLFCTGCYRQFTEFFPTLMDLDFEVQYYTQFLSDRLDKINLASPVEKVVTFHDSCCLARRGKDSESPRRLLAAIPGLKLVEMEQNREETLCCGGIANMAYPPLGQMLGQTLVEAALKTGADHMVNVCRFCDLSLRAGAKAHSLGLLDVVTLLSEAMGGTAYEDKIDTYWNCGSVEEIIERSRENFVANGYTEEEMRQIVPMLFASVGS